MTLRTLAFATMLAATFLLVARASDAATPADRVTVRPIDTGKALVNPMMGWVFHYYSDSSREFGWNLAPSDTLDDFPGLSTIYLRIPWAYLEPSEGQFNWAMLDTPAQRWIAKGKKIAIRITSTEGQPRYATPVWVKDAGAKGHYMRGHADADETTGTLWEPNYDDPVFLDKLDGLVKALGQRYDGNPNVAFVDIGSYGMWGEGHKVNVSGTPDADAPVYQKHTDLYLKYFKKTLLTINDDTIGPQRQGHGFITTEYARARGVTLRDDSILVARPPHSYYHAELAGDFWPDRPVVLEHQPYGGSVNDKAWFPELLLQAVEDYHASFLSLHWWPRIELDENREIITRINRRLGYRIVPREIEYPAKVLTDQPFTVDSTWANAGVAPCYPGGFYCLTIKDELGGIVSCLTDDKLDMRTLPIAPPDKAAPISTSSTFTVGKFGPHTKSGVYDVFLSVGQRDGTPEIALPIAGDDGQHRYKIGRIAVEAPSLSLRPSLVGFAPGSKGIYSYQIAFETGTKPPAGSSVFIHLCKGSAIIDQPASGFDSKPETWPIGKVTGHIVTSRLPSGLEDGTYQFLIGLWFPPPGDGSRVELAGQDDGELRYLLGTIVMKNKGKTIAMPGVPNLTGALPPPPALVKAAGRPVASALDPHLTYDVAPMVHVFEQTAPRRFRYQIDWDVRQTAPNGYVPFVHLTSVAPAPDPLLVLPEGLQSAAATWPVGRRQLGDSVEEELPENVPDGVYLLKAGLFRADGKPERLKLAAGDDGATRVLLGTLTVSQSGAKIAFAPTPPAK